MVEFADQIDGAAMRIGIGEIVGVGTARQWRQQQQNQVSHCHAFHAPGGEETESRKHQSEKTRYFDAACLLLQIQKVLLVKLKAKIFIGHMGDGNIQLTAILQRQLNMNLLGLGSAYRAQKA
jgi:hypothetical protein